MDKTCFIDSNILIYSVTNEQNKSQIARCILADNRIVISTQALNEFCNVTLKKRLMTIEQVSFAISVFLNDFHVVDLGNDLVIKALNIKNRYQYSYWDSLIIATALKTGVKTLYSEDMSHSQVIDNRLTIINPFNTP